MTKLSQRHRRQIVNTILDQQPKMDVPYYDNTDDQLPQLTLDRIMPLTGMRLA
jgi:hypothetical protein